MEMQITWLIEMISAAYPIGVAYQIMIRSTNYSIIKYMKEYDVRKKLESNSKLCMLSDEKLKAAIEK